PSCARLRLQSKEPAAAAHDCCAASQQEPAMSAQAPVQPRRVENLHTDKGKVPVYATGVVDQNWAGYSAEDHATWATLFERQRRLLVGRASSAFLEAQDAMGMTPDRIPKHDDLNRVLEPATGWRL